MSYNTRTSHWPPNNGNSNSSTPQTISSATLSPNLLSTPTNVAQPGSSTCGKANATRHAMLSTLKGSMKFLRKGCRVFPPLESAVGTLLDAVECVGDPMNDHITKQNDNELCEMASDLPRWVVLLSAYLSDSQPEGVSESVKRLAEDLLEQAKYIRDQQQPGTRRSIDPEALGRCYRRIETSFRQLQTDASLSTWKIADDHLKESRLNALSPVHDARYDSSLSDTIERGPCFQNTRVSVLEGIRDWIRGSSNVNIYWTNGMAGTGKTTIAYSVCTELKQRGQLGASYFCSRASSESQDVKRILPTIAYQLARQFYPFRSSLCRILGQEADVGQRNISVQFEHLIKTPLLEVNDVLPNGLVIVVDALDECSNPRTVKMMLDVLFRHISNLPIRFFLTSRPEPSIANTILGWDKQARSILHLHNVEEHFVKDDIETYLTVKLAELRLNGDTLSGDTIKQLADQAGILFIYAATVARYLTLGPGANVPTRLKIVLAGSTSQGNMKDKDIDKLYKTILGGVLGDEQLEEDEIELIKQVLWTVVCAREPVTKHTLAALLGVDAELVLSAALDPLRSVLNVTEGSEVVSTLHASFSDFMLSSNRSRPPLYCNETRQNENLARRCFVLMAEQLRFNICGLETSYRFDEDVPNIKDRVEPAISSELFYACRYWIEHLRQTPICDESLACLDEFLHKRLLFWMEVLNLKGWMSNGPKILAEVQKWLQGRAGTFNTSAIVRDARNFVTTFAANPVRQSTPHIYVSGLPLVSRRGRVWEIYGQRARDVLWADGTLVDQREETVLATWEVGYEVSAIAHSPDGARIVLALSDHTLRVRDAHSGAPLGNPFNGHTKAVRSVAFSPDGTHIVSGSSDRTIRLWDIRSGTQIGEPLAGHFRGVNCVAFSPDGTRIISGSEDCTIRVWDMRCSTLLCSPLECHFKAIWSVAFSPDGTRIVSGSADRTVRVWDMRSGTPLYGSLDGHTDVVKCVAFSPDGTRIASSSEDCTIRMWDARSGIQIRRALKGHTDAVCSVAFSPDGAYIASGSSDCTVRLWDASSGTQTGDCFKGHTKAITSVVFSPDGTRTAKRPHANLSAGIGLRGATSQCRLLSGSSDHTIRVWDVRNSVRLDSSLEAHINGVVSAVFSSDGACIISGSADHTAQVWDAHCGTSLGSPFECYTEGIMPDILSPAAARILPGSSITLSSDAPLINSGSDNHTAQVWDAHSNSSLDSPFKCYAEDMSDILSLGVARTFLGSQTRTTRGWSEIREAERSRPTFFENESVEGIVVTSVAFSPDGALIVTGSSDYKIRVWGVRSNTLLAWMSDEDHKYAITSVAFCPSGNRVFSGSQQGRIRVWGIAISGRLSRIIIRGSRDIPEAVTSLALSSDHTRLVSGSSDCTIQVWDVSGRRSRTTWPSDRRSPVSELYLAFALTKGIPTKVGKPLKGHTGAVLSVAFSPDGSRIVSTSSDRTIRVWDVPQAEDKDEPLIFSNWSIDNQGWVTAPQAEEDDGRMMKAAKRPLFWLPVELRDVVPRPPNTLTISPNGSIRVNLANLLLGESWNQHYDLWGANV